MSSREIVLPETKPETEWVRGRALQKVSPTYRHGKLQMLIGMALLEWAEAGGHGRVASEWRFRVTPPGEFTRPLVPDVAFLSYATLPRDAASELVAIPAHPPTVAVEILSPDDRPNDVADKISTYLRSGTLAIFVVDPAQATIVTHSGDLPQQFVAGDILTHSALPGFALDIAAVFERARN